MFVRNYTGVMAKLLDVKAGVLFRDMHLFRKAFNNMCLDIMQPVVSFVSYSAMLNEEDRSKNSVEPWRSFSVPKFS